MKIPKNRPIKDSLLIKEQAERLSKRLLSPEESLTIGAEDNPLREATKVLSGDYVDPVTKPLSVKPGQIADPAPLNQMFNSAKMDLDIIASITTALEDLLVAGHNTAATKESDLVGGLKTLRDRISTLKLYATDLTDDDMYVTFTFTDGSKIATPEEGTPLTYEEGEGALVLPVDKITDVEIKKISIAEGSNGNLGNNFDRTRQRNGSLEAIYDGSPTTMFEYESVGDRRGDPLRLTLQLYLKEPTIINRIVVTPANLGTSDWVEIEDIQLQVDQRFVSVKEDIQSPSWDITSNPFKLSPAASKYAGVGIYTFKPRMAKVVQITFVQNEPHQILNGRRMRYAIALKEIALHQVEFKEEGTFSLVQQSFNRPVTAIGCIQNIQPFDPSLAEINYSISVDGGENWTDIAPLENKDSAKTEAITLDEVSAAIAVRGTMKRLPEGFRQPIGQDNEGLIDRSHVFPGSTVTGPISLEAKPQHYLEVIETRYGHAGNYGPKFFLGNAIGTIGYSQVIELPIKFEKEDISVLVNGDEWQRVSAFTDETEKGFIYDPSGDYPIIVFGDGLADGLGGWVPQPNAELYLKVAKIENPQVSPIPNGYKFTLKYGASKVRESTKVLFRDLTVRSSTRTAGPDSTYIEIPWEHTDIVIRSLSTPELDYINDGSEVTFQNGEIEFQNLPENNYYSVDIDGNRVYFAEPIPRDGGDVTMEYEHTTRKEIPDHQWRYHDSENAIEVRSELIIPKQTNRVIENQIIERVYDLDGDNLLGRPYSIIKGSIQGINLNGINGISRVLQTEVDYINGSEEFERLRVVGSNLLGYFSVNYKENTIHLPTFTNVDDKDKGFLPGKIIWRYISSEVHYNLGRKLEEGREYIHNESAIETTPFFLDRLSDLNRRLKRSVDLHVRYNILGESLIDGTLLEKFYSPVLRDIAIIGIGLDPRLGTLESL